MPPRVSTICLYWEAIHFAMFHAHARVKKEEYPYCTCPFAQNSTVGSILALHGSTMFIATLTSYFQAR